MKSQLLKLTYRHAVSYIPKHSQKWYLHYCYVIQNNQIVEWATNTCGEPPRHFGYHDRIGGQPKRHAEYNAYIKARGLLDSKKPWEIINVRVNKTGELRNSKPCLCCYGFLEAVGCDGFWYSTDFGFEQLKC